MTDTVGLTSDETRWQLSDHLGSGTIEVDKNRAVISAEAYHPYGSTAWWLGNGQREVKSRRFRYTSKERDAETGLQDHGARRYVPWIGRWDGADPAGFVDGTNRYAYVSGRPTRMVDPTGNGGEEARLLSSYADPGAAQQNIGDARMHRMLNASVTGPVHAEETLLGREIITVGEWLAAKEEIAQLRGDSMETHWRALQQRYDASIPTPLHAVEGAVLGNRASTDSVWTHGGAFFQPAAGIVSEVGYQTWNAESIGAGTIAIGGLAATDVYLGRYTGMADEVVELGIDVSRVEARSWNATLDLVVSPGAGTKASKALPTPAAVRGTSPVSIPAAVEGVVQQKTGYNQIRFRWSESGHKLEARWHTRTPGAPEGQGDSWVITRTTPGTPTGQQKVQHVLTGDQWTPMAEWMDAVQANQAGAATAAQRALLQSGHHAAGGY